MQKLGPRNVLAALGIAAFAVVLVGCGVTQHDRVGGVIESTQATAPRSHTPPARSSNDLNDAAAIEKSYTDAVASLTTSFPLPQSDSYPAASQLSWDPTVIVGADLGESNANFYWRCSWANEYFKAAESHIVRKENSALDMLAKWPSTPYFLSHVQDGEPGWVKGAVDPARAGDDSVLRSFSGRDCTFFYDNTLPRD